MKRKAEIKRKSYETNISLSLCLEGEGNINIKSGIGFFDHMLTLLAAHGSFDMELECIGDLHVDGHHTVEDIGIVLGKAFREALGDKKGITRYGTFFIPMDESLAMVSVDISGRPYLHYDTPTMSAQLGDFDTQLVEEFLRAFCIHAGLTLHARVLYGKNVHHIIEAIFKALGHALRIAVALQPDTSKMQIPSTKGILD